MRLVNKRAHIGEVGGEPAGRRRRPAGSGWGPFSGRQLTVIIVAVVVMVGFPVGAFAASAAFTSNSAAKPAVAGANSNAHGIGVQGAGKKFGVLSNGPLGVAAGKPLSCGGCVGVGDLSSAAQAIQPLAPGQSETGAFAAGDVYPAASKDGFETAITLVRPVSSLTVEQGGGPHCTTPGSAPPGFLCLYYEGENDAAFGAGVVQGSPVAGVLLIWSEQGAGDAYARGSYTVTAP